MGIAVIVQSDSPYHSEILEDLAVLQRASVYVERTFRFLAVVVEEAPEMPDGSSTTFIQDLIADILKLATAQEKIVRIRACSLLSNFMLRLRIEVDDETLDDVQQTMLDRLKDKVESNLSAIILKAHSVRGYAEIER